MRRSWFVTLVASVGVGVGAGAAGASVGPPTPEKALVKGRPEACVLFTSKIAAAALGGPVDPPQTKEPHTNSPQITFCRYDRTDGSANAEVRVGPWLDFLVPHGTRIRGIGDYATGGINDERVAVCKGGTGFDVLVILGKGFQRPAEVSAQIEIAKQLVAKLRVKSNRARCV